MNDTIVEETTRIKNFKDLKVWQKGIEIVKDVYKLTQAFPKEEVYGLTSQIRRSAVSIPANIAEGFKRYHNKEQRQFLHVALGSSAELETHLIIAKELDLIDARDLDNVLSKLEYASKMISSLLRRWS